MTEQKRATKAQRDKIVKLVGDMMLAQRNANPKREQAAYDKLRAYCEKLNVDFGDAILFGQAELRKSIAANMGGMVR